METMNYRGVEYVGIESCPRGFSNERNQYVARADNAEVVKEFERMVAEPREGGWCTWMTRLDLSQHFYHCRESAEGMVMLRTLSPARDFGFITDSLTVPI